MAFDFTNRDTKDPRGVATIVPYASDGYLPAGENDWSQFTTDPTAAQQQRLTRKINVALVTLNNGEQYFAVQDERGQPIDLIGNRTGIDTKQAETFKGQQAQANAQAGVTKPSNVYVWTNPSTGKSTQVSEWPDGHKSYDETQVPAAIAQAGNTDWHPEGAPDGQGGFNNTQPIMVRTVNGQRQTREPTSAELKDWNEASQRSRNPGGKTDDEIRTQQQQNAPKPVATNTTDPYIVQARPDGTIVPSANPNYVGPKPDHATVKGADGRTYVVSVPPGGGQPTATAVAGLPAEPPANPTAQTPPLPNFVLGSSIAALGTYKASLQEGVAAGRWSQDWADKRWGEAYQVAQFATNEHVIQQREAESQLNARTTLATTKLTTMQTGLDNALAFVKSINGTLPPGSGLGGQAFAALLGLQALMLKRSGINDIDPTSARAPAPTVTPADLADPARLAAKRDEIDGHLDAALGPVAAGVTATNAAAITPSGPTVEAANRAVQAGSGAAFGALGVPAQPPAAAAPPTAGEPGGPPLQPGPVLGDPTPPAPAPKATPAPDAMAPASDFAALAQYQAPAPPPLPGLGTAAPTAGPDDGRPPHAMLAAKIAATPPWRLSQDELAWAQANGLEQDAWAVPGGAAA